MLIRDMRPFPEPTYDNAIIIPFFSLFSIDPRYPKDFTLLEQLLYEFDDPLYAVRKYVIRPILECYKFQALDLGLIPENNAQNILLELSTSMDKSRIIHRDMMGTFKDLTRRKEIGLSVDVNKYHSIDLEQLREDYYKRRSFAYDFKLGEYVFSEIEEVMCRMNINIFDFRSCVKEDYINIFGSSTFHVDLPD